MSPRRDGHRTPGHPLADHARGLRTAKTGGTLTTGGSEATFTALLAARAALLPDSWANGVATPPLLVCGEHAHYAVTRAAGALGLGLRNVRVVPSVSHRMDPARSSRRSMPPIVRSWRSSRPRDRPPPDRSMISRRSARSAPHAGSGCTSTARTARRRSLAHTPAPRAWDRARQLGRARSAQDDAPAAPGGHAVWCAMPGCSMPRSRSRRPISFTGTTRRRCPTWVPAVSSARGAPNVLKLWVSLQRYGADGIGALYDHLCDVARALYNAVCQHPAFEAVHEPECNIVCFRRRGSDELNRQVRESYNRSGAGWITTTMLDGRRVLRATIMNPRTTTTECPGRPRRPRLDHAVMSVSERDHPHDLTLRR